MENQNLAKDRTMEEVAYKCIRCDETAYETKKDEFKCSHCDFEWEILR